MASASMSSPSSPKPGRTKTLLLGFIIFILACLFIGFLAAYIVEHNKINELSKDQSSSTTTTTSTEISSTFGTTSSSNSTDPSITTSTSTRSPIISDDQLLDHNVIPINYHLQIRTDPNQNFFNGSVRILLQVLNNSIDQIVLNCKNLDILNSSLESSITIKNVHIDQELERCIFELNESLKKGEYALQIFYSSTFRNGQIIGFYRSSYTTIKNEIRYMTATKFEPTYARMAFPCFDEPSFKATFNISLIYPTGLTALSNQIETETVSIIDEPGFSQTTFAQTPKMSTYLVAFSVNDFEYTETRTTFGTRVRVYSRPDQVKKTTYACESAATILSYYENITAIPYSQSMAKLDLIGLPEFVSGAMENWGLVTYKETYVLFDANESSSDDKRKIAQVIAHELAHMWIGNLVTAAWWNDLWLQEGFASFIEYYGQNHLQASLNIWNRFLIDDLHPAFRTDSLSKTHPLVPNKNDILTPDQITAQFDTISYSKGASIAYMIESIISRQKFLENFRHLLQENQYSNVDTEKMMSYFYQDIETTTKMNGKKFLNQWLYQNGFPIVTVERKQQTSKRSTSQTKTMKLQLKQSIYRSNSSSNDSEDDPRPIYVKYIQQKREQSAWLFNQTEMTVELENELAPSDWIKLNPDGHDYYIVNYQPEDWDLLITELKRNPKSFNVGDRANLLHDAYLLSEISGLSYERLLNLFTYLEKETNYVPWSVANNAITSLINKLGESGMTLIQFRDFIKSIIANLFDSNVDLSTSTTTIDDRLTPDEIALRNVLISIACKVGYEKCTKQCYQRFRDWMDNGRSLDSNTKFYVYKYGLHSSTIESDWQSMWNLYQSEKDAIEKSKIMSALTSTTDPNLLSVLISYSDDPEKINNENFFSAQQSIASNSDQGRLLIWEYIRNHWPKLIERFGLNDRRLGTYVRSVISGFRSESRLQEIQDFFKQYPDAGAGQGARDEAIETIRKNIQWIENNQQNVSNILNQQSPNENPWKQWRLGDSVLPKHYDVNLTVLVDEEKFSGSVRIEVEIQRPIRHLILHSKDLNITSSAVFTKQQPRVEVSIPFINNNSESISDTQMTHFAYRPNQFWVIPLQGLILPETYIVELQFNGNLSKELSGLYLSQYQRSDTGEFVKLATTQFQAGYARKAFPCFDEPNFKATFALQIEHGSNYSAISNMPTLYVQQSLNDKNMKMTVFERSVKMSTYLVAIVVSDFVSKSSPLLSNFSVYTFDPAINLDKTDYALRVGPQALEFYSEKYFEIGFPLPKMDMISIPDFAMGAMENWGLVTYRDVYVLYDAKETSTLSKARICQIICHELAHMWFGNLVTMKWWDDLWLNEGFATFMEYKAVDYVETKWNYHDFFAINEYARVYESDSMPSTHPLLTKVTDDNSVQAVFDSITYSKGSCIIRMLESLIGDETFRIGIKNYIKKYSYSTTLTNDLWNELSNVADKNLDVEKIMQTWLQKDGFPIITITINNKNNSMKFLQERFFKDSSNSISTYLWSIPITYRLINQKFSNISGNIQKIIMDTKEMYRDDLKIETDDLIKFNVDQKGLYIVNYPIEQWKQWIETMNNSKSIIRNQMSALDRNNLLMDAFYLARSGRLPYRQCLGLAEFLQYEKSYMVWSIAADMLGYLRVFMAVQDQSVAFDRWVRTKLIAKHYDDVGWNAKSDDNMNQLLFRSLILNLACKYGHQDCRKKASQLFDEYRQSPTNNYDPDILPVFLFHAQNFNSTEDNFNFLQERYNQANTTNEKMTYLKAMTANTDENMLRKLLNNSLNTTYLRTQDFFTFLMYMSDNSVGLDLAWDFYREHYPEIQQRYGLDDSNVGRAVYRFAFHFTTNKRREEVMELFQKYPEAGASELYRQQTIDLIDANIRWSKSYYKNVIEYVTDDCDSKHCPWNQYRLNQLVKPTKYDLTIQIDTDTFRYNGTVKIQVNIDDEIDHIILHAADILDVSSPKITRIEQKQKRDTETESNLSTGRGFTYSPLDFYVIPLKEKTTKGDNYIVELNFDGNLLKTDQVGLYRGWYDDNNGTRINLAATQFESTHARKMFPCFDEPAFKSNISITVIHPKKMSTTLSNMDIISTNEIDDNLQETKFNTTPPMVTYLIAILVSNFKCTPRQYVELRNLTINVCSSPLYSEYHHEYSLSVTPKILKFYETYTGIEYSLPKLDQIALPQFSAGAMENWGIIKYRQKKLMWYEMDNLSEDKKDTCNVIAHELAHMWFGDLVTMNFWGDLWLNEGFASFMEYKGMNAAHPEWNIWDTFVQDHTYKAIVGDYEQTSQPLIRKVNKPNEMNYMTRIVYNKGSTILNMFENTMGSKEFQQSIQTYLNSLQFQTATSENLYEALETNWLYNDTQNAREFFTSWTEQIGFPYLNITCDEMNKSCTYVQERFIRNGDRPSNDLIYVIPFQYYTYEQQQLKKSSIQFLSKKTGQIDNFDGIKINPNFNGFYFVNYPGQQWSKLINNLITNENNIVSLLTVNDRSELITSSYFLSRAKLAPFSIALDIYNYLVHETHYVPWTIHSKLIANLAWEMERTEYRESYLHFERRLTQSHYSGIDFWNFENTTIIDRMFRKILIQNACGSGNKQCLKDALTMFGKWKDQNNTIQPDLFTYTLSYAMQSSKNLQDYEFVWQRFLSEKITHTNKTSYLEALSHISDSKIVQKYLDLALNESIVSNNHFVEFFVYIIHRYEHEQMIWQYFTENYSMLSRKLSTSQMDMIITRFADHTVTEKRRLIIWNFLKDKQTGVSMSGQESTFARIEYNLAWMTNNKVTVGEWFGQNACGRQTPEPCPWAQTRINKTIIQPKHYDLTIQVNLTTNIYNGSVVIQIEALQPFEYIVLHAAQMLQVKLISVKNSDNYSIEDVTMFRYLPKQFVVIEFDQQQSIGQYELTFNFTANLLDAGISGLYRSNYTNGNEHFKMASTQFEFFDARKVFPCFDEPAFKSKFNISIIHDKEMNTTLSNMEVIEVKPIPNTQWIQTRFNQSLDMVTYLVAMAVSNFVCKNYTIENNQVNVGVCASHLQGHKLDYALEKAPKCLSHLEKKLGHPYPMNKVDLIAIPDFYYGAMENWGLITFRETALLFNEQDTTSERKMSIMNTIAHELAHFWFGNLVTCEWWDFIALNEAFATYMQYTTVDEVEPEWKTFDLFLISEFEYGLTADAKDNHPLIRNVTRTEQSEQADSSIIYSKGASILRMIETVMGTEHFYSALRDYLNKHKFTSVRPEMLLAEFDNKFIFNDIDQTVKMSDFIQDWFFSNGIPYINVTESSTGSYHLVQDRFLLQDSKNDTIPIWKIPIKYYIDSGWDNTNTKFMIDKTMDFTPGNIQLPINLNARHSGYYLVNYPSKIWKQWIDTFMDKSSEIPVLDRSGIMMDAFYLAQANLLSYNVPLNLAKYLVKEEHLSPWTTAIRGFSSIQRYISHSSSYKGKFREYLQNLIKPVYENLGWNDTIEEPVTKRRLRSSILEFACFNQINDCLEQSDRLFQQWIIAKQNQEMDKIPNPNLLSTVLEYGIQNSNSTDQWLFVWSQYSNETSSTLRSIYMNALAQTNDEKLLTMLLTQALNADQVIRSQDSYSVFIAISGCDNPKSLAILWKFIQDNYSKFIRKGSPLRLTQISSLLNSISSRYFFTADQKNEMKQFFAKYPNIGLTQNKQNDILNKIDNNINWIANRMIEVERFLLCGNDVCPFTEFRLNPNVIPIKYDLSIKVDLDQEQFEGTVEIVVEIKETINYVILHSAKSLNITDSKVSITKFKTDLEIKQTFAYEPNQFWVIEMKESIIVENQKPLNITLNFEFNSKLDTDMTGFYLSKYNDNNGNVKKLAATQFQDTHARQAFPCFDEPSFKSIFHVTIEHHANYTAISNTKIKSNKVLADETEWTKTEFEETPKMVTYLLAFIISDFDCKQNETHSLNNDLINVDICSSPPEIDNTAYSLTKAPDIIENFQKRLNYPYQLDKMHLVALPDFNAGAMENWGLLTFRETALLWNDLTSSAADKMSVVAVVAHEITHMWFGNLVTCDWWTDLWLNEAFASYLEWFAVDNVEPDWNYKQLFFITDYIAGMDADASITAHPLARPSINKASEIPYITPIIYQKGSSILRMFEFVLSTEPFYGQLEKYLKQNQYQTVTTDKFLTEISKIKIEGYDETRKFLESWTLKPGFPYINITRIDNSTRYKITQQRFLSNGKFPDNNDYWIVPLSYYIDYSKSGELKIEYISNVEQEIVLERPNDESLPLKFNCDSQGFYIVNYPIDEWNKWTSLFRDQETMSKLSLTSQDYSHLMFDAFRLANVNLLPFEKVFELLEILKTNRLYSVWSTGSNILSKLWPYFRNDNNLDDGSINLNQLMRQAYRSFAHDLVRDVYRDFNLQDSSKQSDINSQRLRSTVTSFACAYGFDLCLAEAQVEFKKWRNGYIDRISPNIITVVLRYAIQESNDADDWNFVWEKYIEEQSTVMKLNYLQALAQTQNKELLIKLMDYGMEQKYVRRQDYLGLYTYILRTPVGLEIGWQYFQQNYRRILSQRLSSSNIGRLATYFARYLYTEKQLKEFQQFFIVHRDTGVSDVNLNKSLETIQTNIAWTQNYRVKVFEWLRNRQ